MIGYFGDIVFETSDKKILTFTSFKHDSAGRWEKHNVIGTKPISEFVGPDLDTITFTINLNGSYGVKPRDEMEKWIGLVNSGIVDVLVIGTKALGQDKWSVKGVSEAWDVIFNKGELFSGKIDVTLEEYIESINIVTETKKSSADLDTLSESIKALQYDLNGEYNAKIAQTGVADKDTLAALNGITSIIVKGHKSLVILWIQEKLVNYGYLKQGAYTDKVYDEATFQAVTNMQKNWGRPTDGVLRLDTWSIFLNN
ncbi:phage tail protein [Clostridium magnum]|uniref:Putative peptidoglycan binding domain protein n=1 Tax=Clostridium magnum DSM 2767 TaxID=1121326 RepID=A0A162QMP6_9CLOT|nr:phage tail protein [Clostridium magnum]KZL88721.1 putative peptidoglycan binding domain protein [Clostridium magnum DSM 2767]SHJ43867.1 Putative peptidoglycan binding domain-containing protein [Clostridium magnum DSM 2767]